jgi:hypothetical protein
LKRRGPFSEACFKVVIPDNRAASYFQPLAEDNITG